jgi:ankyrin repeat protein
LHRACRNGNPKIVKLLLDNGAIARPHYYTKYSPLYIACHMGNIEIAQMILEVIYIILKFIIEILSLK